MLDIHSPIAQKDNNRKMWMTFQRMAWERVTLPLVLNEMWAWNDPTQNFYISQNVTYFDERLEKALRF